MSNVFTLDSLREEADKQYQPLTVTLSDGTEAVLKNVLRLNQKARKAILDAIDGINKESTTSDEVSELIETIIKGVSTNASKLLKDLDGDLAVAMKLIEVYVNGSQLPEAESSPDSSTSTASS